MARHALRREGTRSRVGRPLVTLALGVAQLGALGAGVGTAAAAPPPAPAAGEQAAAPCAKAVKACVQLSTNQVWITDGNGAVLRGPIRMNDGGPGQETPTGDFTVQRKDRHHVSQEFHGAAMPYAVFFDGHGRAFHQGDPARQSAGCVRMAEEDARFVFEHLDIGDTVQILA